MKKILALTMVFALLLPVLAGCQSAFAAQQSENPTQAPAKTAAVPTLTREQATEIALGDAALNAEDIYDLDVELDKEQGTLHYDVDFEKDGKDYDYEIDAETRAIINKEVPSSAPVTVPQPAPTVPPETQPQSTVGPMLREEAAAIALAHAGLTGEQVRDLDVERDDERGIPRYEVDFEADGWEYEYEIHAVSGEILYTEKERD